jgi:adenylyl-sulfate kinase
MILDREPNERTVTPGTRVEAPTSRELTPRVSAVTAEQRHQRLGHRPATLWLTGLTGSGKTTLAYALEQRLFEAGCLAAVLDGENIRLGVNKDLGFSADDRAENIRRVAELASLLNANGLIAICAFLSPSDADRQIARQIVDGERFIEVYLSAPQDVCRQRQQRLYDLAEEGQLELFTGVSAPYEPPAEPDVILPTHELDVDACVDRLLGELAQRQIMSQST